MDIYSSQTTAWIYKESEWGELTDVTLYRQPSVFLNGCLHIMGYSGAYPQILAMDMEGGTWWKIPCPCGSSPSIHEA